MKFWQFVTATFVVFPKLALQVFIGSRLAELSDGETRRHMDTREFGYIFTLHEAELTSSLTETKIINVCIIAVGITVTILTSW